MTHRSGGAYRLLERAGAYELFQRALGARRSRRRFVAEILRPEAGWRLLDVGCGTGSLLDDLPPGVTYVGYDLNPHYVAAARRRHGARGSFHCARIGDPAAPRPLEDFDLVVTKGLLHHLDDATVALLLRSAWDALRPGGWLVTLDPTRHPGQSLVARLLMAGDRGARIRTPAEYHELVGRHFPRVEARLLTDMLRIPYSHCAVRAGKP